MKPEMRIWKTCGKFNGKRALIAALSLTALASWHDTGRGLECQSAELSLRGKLKNWFKLTPVNVAPAPAATAPKKAEGTVAHPTVDNSSPSPAEEPHGQDSASLHESGNEILPVAGYEQGDVLPAPPPAILERQGDELIAPPVIVDSEAANAAAPTTLDMLTAQADRHHPRLMTAYQRVQAARGRVAQAGLYPNPVLGISAPQLDGNESQYNGFVSQEFVTAGKLDLAVKAAQREVTQAKFEWQQERLLVLTELREKFYRTLAIQNRIRVPEHLVHVARHSLESSQKLLLAGEGARGDTLLLDIELQRAEVALQNAYTIYEFSKKQLAILVGVPHLHIPELAGDFAQELRPYELEEVRTALVSVHPRVNIARLEVDRNYFLMQRAQVEPIPNFDVMLGYQRQVGIPAQDQGLFQVTMAVPLWNKNQGNIAAAQRELIASRADVQRIQLQLDNMAADAITNFQTARLLVERHEREILPKARQTLELSQGLYAEGQIDFLRLLQSQKTLLDAELAWIDAHEQRWLAAISIAGLLQEEEFP